MHLSVYLQRWLEYFPKEQLLVLYTSELEAKPEETMRKIEKHLGIKARMAVHTLMHTQTVAQVHGACDPWPRKPACHKYKN